MNIAIARPGTFTRKGKERPSTEVNWIYYDAITDELLARGHTVITIGFTQTCGAQRILHAISPFDVEKEPQYKTKTQQAITQSIVLKDNDNLLQDVDALLMPYYTHMGNRSVYFPLMYLATESDIPVVLWDTDANFIGEVSLAHMDWDLHIALERVFCNPTYVVDDYVNSYIMKQSRAAILTPAMKTPRYATYFPFFSIFDKSKSWINASKKYDLVYAGSEYGRRDKVLKYYKTNEYASAIVGKYSKDFSDVFGSMWSHTYKGHISQYEVPSFIQSGLACVQIARKVYENIGHITPRVFEVVYNSTLLLMDGDIYGAERIVGAEFVVSSQEDVIEWLDAPINELIEATEQQKRHSYIQRTVVDAVDDLLETLNEI